MITISATLIVNSGINGRLKIKESSVTQYFYDRLDHALYIVTRGGVGALQLTNMVTGDRYGEYGNTTYLESLLNQNAGQFVEIDPGTVTITIG